MSATSAVSKVANGSGLPEGVEVVQRVDRLGVWMKGLSGPAVCAMLIAFAFLAADWVPLIGKLGVWTNLTEEVRAQGVVIALVILAACVGLVVWVAHAGKPSRTEIKAGPVGVTIEQDDDRAIPSDERSTDGYDGRRDRFQREHGDRHEHR